MPRFGLSVVTLGVSDLARSVKFYEQLGLKRKLRATGDSVAFFDAGNAVIALFGWDDLAADAAIEAQPRPPAFHGVTLACNCRSEAEVDATLAHALSIGATLLQRAEKTSYGGYRGYFADPDGHPWEAVIAPGLVPDENGRLTLAD
ncbi:MAG TPA: VOC family protein [Xanthobacteraceae bacterium]|nr:VOC family protein [Xanthobacteraceae bacterium]